MSKKLDRLVAEKVSGFPAYSVSTEVEYAMGVFELFPDGCIQREGDVWWVSTGGITDFDESLPLAICKIALRAKGVSVEEIKEAMKA